jgi:hypothetical protein
MSIDQHVAVNILVNSGGIEKIGFGTIGVISYKTALFGDNPSLTYRRLAAAITDGFAADSPEALAIERILAQSPHVPQVKLLKATRIPTLTYVIFVADVLDETLYQIKAKGEGVTPTTVEYTSDASATEAEILTNLTTNLNNVVNKNFTATQTPPSSDPGFITVVGDNPGDWFSLEIVKMSRLTIVDQTEDEGIADDLADIMVEDNDWYYLDTPFGGEAIITAAANFIEANVFKFYVAETSDSEAENTAAGGDDIADNINELGLKRTLLAYHRKPDQMLAAGIEGLVAPLNVGTWTAAYKTVAGVSADRFTDTQTDHLDAKKTSYYKTEAGVSIFWEGKVGNTDYKFMDVVVSLDFVLDLLQKTLFGIFTAMPKVSYTDEDIKALKDGAEGVIDICKSDKHKIVAKGTPGDPNDPEPTVSFPRVADIDPGARELRELPDGDITFRLQGAIHTVTVNVTVSF